jgi:predicted PurR-regulated permease PerM
MAGVGDSLVDTVQGRTREIHVLLAAASVVVLIAGLKAASSLILPFLVALFVAMVSVPLLNGLQRRRVPSSLAVLLTLAVVVLAVVALAWLVGGSLAAFTAAAPRYQARLDSLAQEAKELLTSWGFDPSVHLSLDLVNPSRALNLATSTLMAVGTALSNLVMVLLTIVFLLMETAGFPDKLQAAFGHEASAERWATMRLEVQRYLAMKTLISLLTGVVVTIALAIIGVDFPILWGVLAFMLNYIPTLGSIIAAVPPVLLALVQFGLGRAVAVAVVFVAVNVLFGNIIEPQVMGRRLGLSSLVVFLSLVFWGWVWGPVGMLLSVPLTMVVKISLENTENLRWIAVLLDASPKPVAGGGGGQKAAVKV